MTWCSGARVECTCMHICGHAMLYAYMCTCYLRAVCTYVYMLFTLWGESGVQVYAQMCTYYLPVYSYFSYLYTQWYAHMYTHIVYRGIEVGNCRIHVYQICEQWYVCTRCVQMDCGMYASTCCVHTLCACCACCVHACTGWVQRVSISISISVYIYGYQLYI